MDINNIGGSISLGQSGGARRAEVKVPVLTNTATPAPQVPEQSAIVVNEQAKRARLQAAATQAVQNIFVVSDTTFTIYKDAAGQYITRFRSLRDGSVRTFPEQTMYDFVRSQIPAATATLNTEA